MPYSFDLKQYTHIYIYIYIYIVLLFISNHILVGSEPILAVLQCKAKLATGPEQAPETQSPYKNQFNIEKDTWSLYQILSW